VGWGPDSFESTVVDHVVMMYTSAGAHTSSVASTSTRDPYGRPRDDKTGTKEQAMRVVVTGGTGFIRWHVVDKYIEERP